MIHKVTAADNIEYFPWAKKRFEKKFDLKRKYNLKKIQDNEYITLPHTATLLGESPQSTLDIIKEVADIYALELGSNLFVFAPSLQQYLINQMESIMKDFEKDPHALISDQLAPKEIA